MYCRYISIGDEIIVQGISQLTSAKMINVYNISMKGKYILQTHDIFVMICSKKFLLSGKFCMCYVSHLLQMFPHIPYIYYYNVQLLMNLLKPFF